MIKAKINNKIINQFNKNGYVTLDKFIDLKYINKIIKRTELLFKGKFETGIEPDEWNWRHGRDKNNLTRQICNAWKSDTLIRRFVCHKTIGKCVSKLMGWKGARLLQDNVLWKPPSGKSLLFHQDASYDDWIVPQTMVTCWMSLDKTSKDTGTLEYVEGSHKWGLSPPSNKFHAPVDYKEQLKKFVKKRNNKKLNFCYVSLPPGGVSFHHGYTWHGSGINVTQNHRRALVAHCVPIDAKFHPTNIGGTGRIYKRYKRNNTNELDDSFFPILWKDN